MKLDSDLTPYTKINSNWNTKLRANTTEFSEENIGETQ